jgi:hypothetical protein
MEVLVMETANRVKVLGCVTLNGSPVEVETDDRPPKLDQAAFEERKKRLYEVISAKEKGDQKPRKRFLSYADWDVLHENFSDRLEGSESGLVTLDEFIAYCDEEEAKLPAEYGTELQFTPRAYRRVSHSYYDRELRENIFNGRSGVDLLEVERAILAEDQAKEGASDNLCSDEPHDLAECQVKVPGVCVGEFLPRRWTKTVNARGEEVTKCVGSYSPDMPGGDGVMLVCKKCQEYRCNDIKHHNSGVSQDEERLPFPRFMSLVAATEARELYESWLEKEERKEAGREALRIERAGGSSDFIKGMKHQSSLKRGTRRVNR